MPHARPLSNPDEKLVEKVAVWLDEIPQPFRIEVISELRSRTKFCWDCGYDLDPQTRTCFCTNDD